MFLLSFWCSPKCAGFFPFDYKWNMEPFFPSSNKILAAFSPFERWKMKRTFFSLSLVWHLPIRKKKISSQRFRCSWKSTRRRFRRKLKHSSSSISFNPSLFRGSFLLVSWAGMGRVWARTSHTSHAWSHYGVAGVGLGENHFVPRADNNNTAKFSTPRKFNVF